MTLLDQFFSGLALAFHLSGLLAGLFEVAGIVALASLFVVILCSFDRYLHLRDEVSAPLTRYESRRLAQQLRMVEGGSGNLFIGGLLPVGLVIVLLFLVSR